MRLPLSLRVPGVHLSASSAGVQVGLHSTRHMFVTSSSDLLSHVMYPSLPDESPQHAATTPDGAANQTRDLLLTTRAS